MAQVNHKEHIFTKAYHFPGRLRGKSYRTIVAGTQQMDGTWKHLKKWRPPSMLHKKNPKRVQKKVHLGLQLDMASQRCLVADCGFCFATSALAPLASRRGRNWKSECRPDMIRMIENHRFLMFLTLEEQNRVTAQAKRRFSLLSHTPANRHECPCCKPFLDDSCKYQHFVSYPQKSEFQIRHPYKGAESTGCLVFGFCSCNVLQFT